MTLQDAEKIVREYGSVLTKESAADGHAFCVSHLPVSHQRIVQAMKLWLAHDIKNNSLTHAFRNEVESAASRLPYFIDDEEACRINMMCRRSSQKESNDLSTEEFIARAKADVVMHEWMMQAQIRGLSLRSDLSDFIARVEKFEPADSLYWQRVYTLAGLEYSSKIKRSFWDFFS